MRILYLDFDGCLHDGEVYFHPQRGIYIETPGCVLFEWMHILDALLAPHPDVRIVLSTSWVRIRSYSFARKQLTPALQKRVIGATFHHRFMDSRSFSYLPRGVQIEEDVFRRGCQAWFAIDDDVVYWPEWSRDNLILTDSSRGISDPKIQNAIRIMLERLR